MLTDVLLWLMRYLDHAAGIPARPFPIVRMFNTWLAFVLLDVGLILSVHGRRLDRHRSGDAPLGGVQLHP